MAFIPISGIVPQATENGNQANGMILKFYEPGTLTPLAVGIDSTGVTQTTEFILDTEGYTTLSNNKEIPHVDQTYKIALYLNQADANANNTGSAVYVIDDIDMGMFDVALIPSFADYNNLSLALSSAIGEIGDFITTAEYVSDSGIGGAEYKIVAGGTGTDDGGLYLDKTDGSGNQLELIHTEDLYADNFPSLQGAINSAYTGGWGVVVREDIVLTSTILCKRLVSIKGEGGSSLTFNFPASSSDDCIMMAVGMRLISLDIIITTTDYAGNVVHLNSTYQQQTIDEAGGVATESGQNRISNLHTVRMYLSQGNFAGGAATAVRIHHTGVGVNQWSHGAYDCRISGGFNTAFYFLNDQSVPDADPENSLAWVNGYTAERNFIDGSTNGFVFDVANTGGSTNFLPLAPTRHRILNNQMQGHTYSERFAKIFAGRYLKFENNTAYDWGQAGIPAPFNGFPYYLATTPTPVQGGELAEKLGLTLAGVDHSRDVAFDPGMPLGAYDIGIKSLIFRSYGDSSQIFSDTGSGTGGLYTYRDLWELFPGVYQIANSGLAQNLRLDGFNSGALEIIAMLQGRRLFRFYKETIDGNGDPVASDASSTFTAYIDDVVEAWPEPAWLDNDVDYLFWADPNGRTPNDIRRGNKTARPKDPFLSMDYIDTTINQVIWHDGTQWMSADGTPQGLTQATAAEFNDLASSINVLGKTVGKKAFSTDGLLYVFADLAVPSGVWKDEFGATIYTPV